MVRVFCAFLYVLVWVMVPVMTSNAAPIGFSDLLARPREVPTAKIAYGTHAHQFGELWLPGGKGPHRTVILVHGGCWLASLPGTELMAYVAKDLRDHGYAVWSIDYRRIGDDGGGYPGTFLDAAAAVDKLMMIAPAHHLDLRRLVAVGHSAGGHLATWLAGRARIPGSSPLHSDSPVQITGVVSLAGINDLEAYRQRGPDACGGPPTIDALVGAAQRKHGDVYGDTSPIRLLPSGVRQVVVSGALDRIVPPDFGVAYSRAAQAQGDRVTEKTIDAAGHFELIDPGSDAWTYIRSEIDALME